MAAAAAASPAAAAATAVSATVISPAATPRDFLDFVNASPSPWHATAEAARRLTAAGFSQLSEREDWAGKVAPGGRYFVVRNQSSFLAFAVGGKYEPGNGFNVAAAHTDSPCLRVKPISSLTKSGYLSVGVETYGGGLWYSWLDRDLSLAGRAIVAKPDTAGAAFDSRLVRIDRPILRIPSLAIHLNREVNSDGLKLNAESHLPPIMATVVKAALEGAKPAAATATDAAAPAAGGAGAGAAGAAALTPGTGGALTRHHTAMVKLLAAQLGVEPEAVRDFDLCLYDTQAAALGGLHEEFIYSARLDNLMMTYTTLMGLINSVTADGTPVATAAAGGAGAAALADDVNVRIAASFDHEEVGSSSVPGAGSTLLEDTLKRLCPDPVKLAAAIRKSVLVSADMAHAVHPNYAALHEENHRPAMHGGIVLKCNTNQRYATTSVTAFLFRQLAAEVGVPVQNFVVRQDMGCGSTIGPIVATRLGLRTVDVGIPQLSMHSCREMCGCDDVGHGVVFFSYFYGRFAGLDAVVEHAD